MNEENAQHQALLNSSGFPLQLAVEQAIRSNQPHWEVSREVPWNDETTAQSGFIDLVARVGFMNFVIECKRPRGGRWLFVTSSDSRADTFRGHLCWTFCSKSDDKKLGFEDMRSNPPSHESDICIVGGQAEDQRPMLERLSSSLLASQLSLAREDVEVAHPSPAFPMSVYIPMIVTCAQLIVAPVDPTSISLTDGTISQQDFQPVSLVRFRKNLLPPLTEFLPEFDLGDSARDREATIFVIHADALPEVLRDWGLRPRNTYGKEPWAHLQA